MTSKPYIALLCPAYDYSLGPVVCRPCHFQHLPPRLSDPDAAVAAVGGTGGVGIAYFYVVESGRGRPRVDLELRLRLSCLPQWYDLSDPATEEEVTDSLSMRHFAGLSLEARVPDETTLCKFRHLLEEHSLGTRSSH